MVKNKIISISDKNLKNNSLLHAFSMEKTGKPNNNNDSKPVQIVFQNENLYSRIVPHFNNLDNHFDDFFTLKGYLQSGDTHDIASLYHHLNNDELIILIGNDPASVKTLLELCESPKAELNTSYISTTPIYSPQKSIHNLGYARHLTSKETLKDIRQCNNLSLGDLKQNLHQAEHMLRECGLAIADLNIINYTGIGLSMFEFCKLTRYIGYSRHLKFLYLFTEDTELSQEKAAEFAVSTWYFLEGRQHRTDDYPTHPHNKTYIVYSNTLDLNLTFVKSEFTGRWWLKPPGTEEKYISVSDDEYDQIVKDGVPDRLLKMMHI